jgi:hypothetical protein
MRDEQLHSRSIADLLARGYLRLLERSAGQRSNLACSLPVRGAPNLANSLDVAAQQMDELGAQD